jgi:hypothetical protein
MKKLLILLICILYNSAFSQGTVHKYYMHLFDSTMAPQFAMVNNVYTYVGTDKGLKIFFANYNISYFEVEFKTIDQEYFKKILRLETTSPTLANALMTNYPSVYEKYGELTNIQPAQLLSDYPNDYGVTNPTPNPNFLYNEGTIDRTDLDYMEITKAWHITTGIDSTTMQPVKIGISDIKVNSTDPDFIGKVTYYGGVEYYSENHGTNSGGIAAARGGNNYGSVGVCYNCSIVNTLYGPDTGGYGRLVELAQQTHARVINMSWARMYSTNYSDPATHEVFQGIINYLANDLRVVLVGGAGNQSSYQTNTDWYCDGSNQSQTGPGYTGMRYGFPANFDNVISVSSVYHKPAYTLPLNTSQPPLPHIVSPTGVDCYELQGAIGTVNGTNPSNPVGVLFNGWARYCNIGLPNQYSSSPNGLCDAGHTKNPQVDILAPTHDTFQFYWFTTSGHPIVYSGGGTSGSTPRVSGTAALMLSVNSCLYPKDVDAILKLTTWDVEHTPINQIYAGNIGAGALNTGEAVVFVNEMKKTNGVVKIKNHIFDRFDFLLNKINNKLSIENVTFKDNCIADFTARNEIRVLPGTRFSPNSTGKVRLKTYTSMDITCTPIVYPKMASASSTDNNPSRMVLYPNPNDGSFDLFNVNFEDFGSNNLNVFVFDINGRKLYENKISKNETAHFDIQNLRTGIYILKLESALKTKEIKFIKN